MRAPATAGSNESRLTAHPASAARSNRAVGCRGMPRCSYRALRSASRHIAASAVGPSMARQPGHCQPPGARRRDGVRITVEGRAAVGVRLLLPRKPGPVARGTGEPRSRPFGTVTVSPTTARARTRTTLVTIGAKRPRSLHLCLPPPHPSWSRSLPESIACVCRTAACCPGALRDLVCDAVMRGRLGEELRYASRRYTEEGAWPNLWSN